MKVKPKWNAADIDKIPGVNIDRIHYKRQAVSPTLLAIYRRERALQHEEKLK